jgi:predicted metal-dependent enzyme (double-stranded beta helix superfamily)
MTEILDIFVDEARAAAGEADPSDALRALLIETLNDCDAMADAIAAQPKDEVLLFEDQMCSIWSCRYDPDVVLPPHEHCMKVHVAVYRGTEVELLYQRDAEGLHFGGATPVHAGGLVSLGPDAVHAVTANGDGQSPAIHIYEGPLTDVKRRLFNWTDGSAVDFTMENFHSMLRKRADVPELNA